MSSRRAIANLSSTDREMPSCCVPSRSVVSYSSTRSIVNLILFIWRIKKPPQKGRVVFSRGTTLVAVCSFRLALTFVSRAK